MFPTWTRESFWRRLVHYRVAIECLPRTGHPKFARVALMFIFSGMVHWLRWTLMNMIVWKKSMLNYIASCIVAALRHTLHASKSHNCRCCGRHIHQFKLGCLAMNGILVSRCAAYFDLKWISVRRFGRFYWKIQPSIQNNKELFLEIIYQPI